MWLHHPLLRAFGMDQSRIEAKPKMNAQPAGISILSDSDRSEMFPFGEF
jgi:hypothetical protein